MRGRTTAVEAFALGVCVTITVLAIASRTIWVLSRPDPVPPTHPICHAIERNGMEIKTRPFEIPAECVKVVG